MSDRWSINTKLSKALDELESRQDHTIVRVQLLEALVQGIMDHLHIKPVIDDPKCPTCGGPLEDMRGTAFSPDQYRREVGKCFRFDENTYECSSSIEAKNEH